MDILNKQLFLIINSYANKNHILDFILIKLSQDFIWFLIIMEFYLFFFKKEKDIALFGFYSSMLSLSINSIVGIFYFHNRPFMDGLGNLLVYHVSDNSFPSDHTSFMLAISITYIIFSNSINFKSAILLFSILSAISRVFIGVHYPMDILAGIIIGATSSIYIYILKKEFYKINQYIILIFNKYSIKKNS